MKVIPLDSELNARLASWLSFLRAARKVTLQSLAQAHGTHRSNLSTYVKSKGTVRNVSLDKVQRVLFELGVLTDGSLTPGLHRWSVSEAMLPEMCSVLADRDFDRAFLFELGSGYGVYAVIQVTRSTLIFASLPAGTAAQMRAVLSRGDMQANVISLDRAGDAQIQALWMTPEDSVVESRLLALIE
jgi:transcriptional regulator with XRE-family HTH domain